MSAPFTRLVYAGHGISNGCMDGSRREVAVARYQHPTLPDPVVVSVGTSQTVVSLAALRDMVEWLESPEARQ